MKTRKVENIQKGDVILTQLRKVKGGKLQLEFAEIVETPASRRVSDGGLLQMGNKSDERFTGDSARRAWASFEPEDIKDVFTEISDEIEQCASGELYNTIEVNYLNPKAKGTSVHVQVLETMQPTNSNLNYAKQGRGDLTDLIKQDGNGNYLRTEDGYGIFSNTRPVALEKDEFDHVFIAHHDMVADPFDVKIAEADMRPAIVGDAQEQEEEQEQEKEEAPY